MDRLRPDHTTSHPAEMQTKAEEMTVQQAVKEILDREVEEDVDDPLEGLTNVEIAGIYKRLKPEDQHLFHQFKASQDLLQSSPAGTGNCMQDLQQRAS